MENKENLLDALSTLFKWKKVILLTCLFTALCATIISLLLPVYYKATTVFYAASPDLAIPELVFGNSSAAPEYYGTENDMNRLMSIAKSNELATHIIDSCNLYEHYGIDPNSPKGPYYIQLKFAKHFGLLKTRYDAIELSVEDRDKELATRIANTARDFINAMGQQLIKNGQLKVIRTFEDNIRQKEEGLHILNDSLQRVRETFGVYNHVTQSEVLSEMLAKAESKMANSQARLESLKGNTHFRDSIALLQANIKGFEKELEHLQRQLSTFNKGMALVETMKSTQSESSAQLSRDRERLKQLRAVYQSEFPTVLLLEPATVPIIKERPKRSLIVVASTVAAFILTVLGALVFETYRHVNWKKVMHQR